ncbi:actin-97 [Anaeramoeba flamelloides]|uniref:Actin-97 n=1 Tax=Anaeramoeba flamelloides TaxID=1746091 RepID=A0AAV7Z8I1_9EUKA|nr:actin-97 [Anaeramoeba flamelloides]
MDELQGLVIDNGSLMIKAGFTGDDAPRAVFPSVVRRPRHKNVMVGMGQYDLYIGEEAQTKRAMLKLTYPIEKGIVTNWYDMEKIWHQTFFTELRVAPEEHQVLHTESLFNPKSSREKICQIMFETFNVCAMYLIPSHILNLYTSGRLNGCSVDMGSDISCCCITEGKIEKNTISNFNCGGQELTNFLQELLSVRGYSFTTSAEREIARDIKESLCFCLTKKKKENLRIDELIKSSSSSNEEEKKYIKNYELPDGQTIQIGRERFLSTELLFRSKNEILEITGLKTNKFFNNETEKQKEKEKEKEQEKENEYSTLPEMVYKSIKNGSTENQNEMFKNIVLGGGNSKFEGIQERLNTEINAFWAENPPKIKVIAPPERKYSTWIGGSIMTSLSTFENKWLTKDEYDENGPIIIHTKCNDFN